MDAIRRKKNSSMVLALNAVKEGRAAACISGGNSGALLAGGQFLVGRAKGLSEPHWLHSFHIGTARRY